MLPFSLCCYILYYLFVNSCHKLGNIGKHLCALLATNTLYPRSCELWYWMKNVHHWLLHAFLVALSEFSSLASNASKLGLDLDDIIFPKSNKSVLLSKLAFSFAHGCIESIFFSIVRYSKISCNHTNCKRKSEASIIWFGTPLSYVRSSIRDKASTIEWNLPSL
jgi:hypothetical protein